MKLVYSLWSKPINDRWAKYRKGVELENLWDSSINCLRLSILYAKKWGFEIEVVTDLQGEESLYELPIDKISTDLEHLSYNGKTWVEGKIYAMSKQNEPFIHIDWDVFLIKSEVAKILKGFKEDVIVQSVDEKSQFEEYFTEAQTTFAWYLDYEPYHIPGFHKLHDKAFNCGIVGFNDMELKDEYCKAFTKCLKVSKNFEVDTSIIIEQYLLYALVEAKKRSFKTLLPQREFNQTASRIGYTHLIYLSKYQKEVQERVKQRIKNEFPEKGFLVAEKTRPILGEVKLSLCTVVMNRKKHLLSTLKENYENARYFNGDVDIHILDYNSTDGLKGELFRCQWFVKGIDEGIIHYYRNHDAKKYHRTLPKNVIHRLAKGDYEVNIDADNFVSKPYLHFCLNHIEQDDRFFIRPDREAERDTFGRILLKREDFLRLGGYNLSFSTYGFEDGELAARLKLLGRTQFLAPAHTCMKVINHDDTLRIEDKNVVFGIKRRLKESEMRNKQHTVVPFPNIGKTIECVVYKIDKDKKELVHDTYTHTLDETVTA